jgi:bacteriorhodopsin
VTIWLVDVSRLMTTPLLLLDLCLMARLSWPNIFALMVGGA